MVCLFMLRRKHLRGSRWIGPLLGIIVLVVFLLLPPIDPLTKTGMKVIGVFLFTVIWWVTIGIGFPSLICIALLALTGVMSSTAALASSTGTWLPVFLIGCFGLSEGLRFTGFSKRFALWFVTRRFVAGRPWMLLIMFLLACTLLGAIMSSAATTIVFMAIGIPMLEALGYEKGDPFAATFVMGIAWAASASFTMTPIAHAGNVLLISWVQRDFGYNIGFLQWMLLGIPMGLLLYLLLIFTFRYVVRPDASKISDITPDAIRGKAGEMGKMTIQEKLVLLVFLVVILVWMAPGILRDILPGVAEYLDNIGLAITAIVGASLLCVIRVKSQPLVSFKQWMTGVEWETVFLTAAIMILGTVLSRPDTGIPQMMAGIFQPIAESSPFLVFLLIAIAWVVLQANVMSHLVSQTLVYSVMVPVAATASIGNPIALGATIAMASNFAFALPSSTAATAIVTGSGWVPVKHMARYGALLIIPIILLSVFIAYPLATLVFRR